MTSCAPEAHLPQVVAYITQVHLEATGQALPPETARAYGADLLLRLGALCPAVQQRLSTPIMLVDQPGALPVLLAGEPTPGMHTITPLDHLIRNLLLREVDAPTVGLTRRWATFLAGMGKRDVCALIEDSDLTEFLLMQLWFLVRTYAFMQQGLDTVAAQRAAAQAVAEAFDATIITQGHSHRPMRTQMTTSHPSSPLN